MHIVAGKKPAHPPDVLNEPVVVGLGLPDALGSVAVRGNPLGKLV